MLCGELTNWSLVRGSPTEDVSA